MGKSVVSLDVPVVKGTNSVTVLTGSDARRKKPQNCIRCGKFVSVCPMGLEPYLLATLSVKAEDVTSCISCGSCQFTCPAHRPLLDNITFGKGHVMGIIKGRAAKAKAEKAKAEAEAKAKAEAKAGAEPVKA